MASQMLPALKARRAEISEGIRVLEARSPARSSLAVSRLIDRLQLRAEWLDKRIELEMRQADSLQSPALVEFPRSTNAA